MAHEAAISDHKAWIGNLQPDGLVFSPAALVDAQVVLDARGIELQQEFLEQVDVIESNGSLQPVIRSLPDLFTRFLGWPGSSLWGFEAERPIPEDLKIALREVGQTLEPTFALRAAREAEGEPPWLLIGREVDPAVDLDFVDRDEANLWPVSASRRFERLLRETGVPIGILTNRRQIRLMFAPRGENAGHVTYPVSAMKDVAGRRILNAFHLLLGRARLFTGPPSARLPRLLARSRDFQASVSTQLADQVLASLYELLRGFQVANEREKFKLLEPVLDERPDDLYAGLLTVLMRLVFLLFAEDREMMPDTSLYRRNYSLHGLFSRLKADHDQYPDTMDSRYGAWAQLISLFRVVHRGCRHPELRMPPRRGYLFDTGRFPFLEGRTLPEARIPLVPDGVIFRALQNLLVLDGERLSYKTLDVEQIGSVYERMMGFRLKVADGPSIAIQPKKPGGAPVPIDLEELLATSPAGRAKWFKERTDRDLTDRMTQALKQAETLDAAVAALEGRIERRATPHPVPKNGLLLVPSPERRRSGSHYTPRSFTEPIVEKALEPVLARLGPWSKPEQILGLKVCDPAVGSGAFLVEACRQLGEHLVRSWHTHSALPTIPPDEDELLHARRLVAQRCLYGVDKNPMAADLAKLSLWLETLAKDHPFTFVDHAIRSGDSLVGLTCAQIEVFNWDPGAQATVFTALMKGFLQDAATRRRQIERMGDEADDEKRQQLLKEADTSVLHQKFLGDAIVAAFFTGKDPKERARLRDLFFTQTAELLDPEKRRMGEDVVAAVKELREGPLPVPSFHWEIEFPEVFSRENPGFDCVVGNPPFLGGKMVSTNYGAAFKEWLCSYQPGSSANVDLVGRFFRASYVLLRQQGALGLIATNTIAQGETRSGALAWISNQGGSIYSAVRRHRWPGEAAVVVSVVHVQKGECATARTLDGREVTKITAYLFDKGGNDDPNVLMANEGKCFQGAIILGMGFTFDDSNPDATSINEMEELFRRSPRNRERVFPFIGGEEINTDPTHTHHRYIINFGEMTEEQARTYPDLVAILERKVRPDRASKSKDIASWPWWRFWRPRPELESATKGTPLVLVNSQVSSHLAFALQPSDRVFAHTLNVYPTNGHRLFTILQSRPHELWARFFASSLEDRLRYTPESCFRTFPFPSGWGSSPALEEVGRTYYEFRARLMVENDEGLTKTYNRFHDPHETDSQILELRRLHGAMDCAVLDAYGWTDIRPQPEFLLEYEEEDSDEDTGASRGRDRKKPYRYRWPDEARDDVLARLLALNEERAKEEALAGKATVKKKSAARKPKPKSGRGAKK